MIHGLVVHKSLDNDCQVLRYSNAALVYEHGLEFSILLCGLAQAAELWNASQLVNWPRVKIARPWSGKTVSFRSCFQHWHAVITCCFARCKKQLIYTQTYQDLLHHGLSQSLSQSGLCIVITLPPFTQTWLYQLIYPYRLHSSFFLGVYLIGF